MALKEKFEKYEDLLAEKDRIEKQDKEIKEKIESMKSDIIQEMIDEETPSIQIGNYAYSLQEKTKYSKKSEADLAAAGVNFFTVLRQNGFGDLITETVNARTLSSAMSELADKNDGELPDDLASVVSKYEFSDIARRKATRKKK